jgi:carbamoyl-phosphate synthase small subunit
LGTAKVGSEGRLVLEDGTTFEGSVFGYQKSVNGEVVFSTGMVGYPEALTDPSYTGQILVLTYPLIGNYGVPQGSGTERLSTVFESTTVQIQGLVVSECSSQFSHSQAAKSLADWLYEHRVPALAAIDTRRITKHLREHGSLLGKIEIGEDVLPFYDPNRENLVAKVSVREPVLYQGGKPKVVLIDCGSKHGILRELLARGATVLRVPWDYDFLSEVFDGVVVSNGPGDPKLCGQTVEHLRRVMETDRPIFGICLGNQLLALAGGGDTYKLKFGHRSHNQPCVETSTRRCYITAQNHGYAVRNESLPEGWVPWFVNANDGTNEGIRHHSRPFMSVQFHPEAAPGPEDTRHLFDHFLSFL